MTAKCVVDASPRPAPTGLYVVQNRWPSGHQTYCWS